MLIGAICFSKKQKKLKKGKIKLQLIMNMKKACMSAHSLLISFNLRGLFT